MHTTIILYRRGRRGTSAILGTLIFVGIMFTAVIPMLLVMKQADTLHEMRKHELEMVDEEKEREYLRVRISPIQDPPSMILKVENKGDLVTKVVRLWVNEEIWLNEEDEDWNCLLNPNDFDEETLVVSESGSYSVIVVTEKGNLFASDNALNRDGYGNWVQDEIYAIYILISSDGTIFHIDVTGPYPSEDVESAIVQRIGEGTVFKAFKVNEIGSYNVKITVRGGTIHDKPVMITDDEKIVWVDA